MSKRREEDCEYTSDTQGLTRTQLLEENISILEARIRELENPSEATSVKLHTPQGITPAPSAHGEVLLAANVPDFPQGKRTSSVSEHDFLIADGI